MNWTHLGVVLGLFLSMPYGKFVHGFYRLVALIDYAMERQEERAVVGAEAARDEGASATLARSPA